MEPAKPVNIKWEEGAPTSVDCCDHQAVWLNGLVYLGGGFDTEWSLHIIYCYNPVSDLWSSPINTDPSHYFAMTTLNNKLLIAGGQDQYGKKTSQILLMDMLIS